MAYRAEIEIGVKGQRELERLRSLITQTTTAFESLNKIAAARGGLNQTLSNYETQLVRAKRAIDNVTAGTQAEVKAIREYVTAMGLANAARDRQNYLIAQEIANRRRVQATINAGFGQQMPALPPSMRNAGFGQQGPAAAARGLAARPTAGSSNVGGLVSNAIIGGAFPLLFGQGGGAATGGAIGGAVGGLFGGAGGFAGSLLGTLLGQIAGQANQVKELAADLGFSAKQTQLLATAFKQAGADFDKFAASVSRIQGLGLALEDQAAAIQLASTLTENYGGKIDKVTNAFTNALQTGKVTQATLNQLTSEGIPIQQALADKYDVSRSKLLEMAKDGKISVQDLLDTLVNLGNNSQKISNTVESSFDKAFTSITDKLNSFTPQINEAFAKLSEAGTSALTNILKALEPLVVALANTTVKTLELYGAFVTTFAGIPGYVENITNAVLNLIPGLNVLNIALRSIRAVQGTQPEKQGPYVPARLQRAPIPRILAPAQMAASGGSAGGKKSAVNRAAEEARRLAATLTQLREQVKIENRSLELQEAIAFARADGNEKLVAFLQVQEKYYDLDEKAAKLQRDLSAGKIKDAEFMLRQQLLGIERKKVEIQEEQRLNEVFRERYGLTNAVIDAARQAREAAFGQGLGGAGTFRTDLNLMPDLTGGVLGGEYEKVKAELQELIKLENQVAVAAQGIGEAFGTSIKGLVSGSMTAQQALANFFQSVADQFADMAAQMIAKWVQMQILGIVKNFFPGSSVFPGGVGDFSGAFGAGGPAFNPGFAFGGFMAAGGPVTGKTPYIVGERGPELFVPGSSGTIVPNSQLGGMGGDVSVVVNVDAKGTNAQGDPGQAKALGSAISAAVQAEIVKQQRPGGLLAGTR